ncbi:hypothetical protein J4412_00395 [Candidatus Pacearchaeota archaeon]|nr:hypothetical protein [Candidatus Pacearchaeota archaeon]
MKGEIRNYLIASSILIGSCIGAGVLGIPYVASKSGFLIALFYIFFVGGIILLINLYLGEVALRTNGTHQLSGYTEKYLGTKWRKLMEFAFIFGVYSAIVAYLIGMGESLSFLIFKTLDYSIYFGIFSGFVMMFLLWKGVQGLKRFEKFGVIIVLALLMFILILFTPLIYIENLSSLNFQNIFLPFGVVLFALLSFSAIPLVVHVLRKKKNLLKKVIITSSVVSIIFYSLFAFVVVGFKGGGTPEIATLALGAIFIFLGLFTMFTSYLSIGNALEENFKFDDLMKKKKSWFLASVIPVAIYILISFTNLFSFTKVLSIGGIISGGLTAILILFMAKSAKKKSDRKPEYSIPLNWIVIIFAILVFGIGVVREVLSIFGKA